MIHPSALVDPSATIDEGVTVEAFAVIGADVMIASGTRVGPHAVIRGPTAIGRDNRIFQFASVGEDPQDKKYAGEVTRLEIGDRNTIREFATLHRGTVQDRGVTAVGNDNLLMAYTHVAHDCVLGDNIILANGASLSGHVHVDDWAILGGFSLVHQFCQLGCHCFTGAGSKITKGVPPYVMVSGHPAEPHGINSEGLRRRDFGNERIARIKRAYKTLYHSGLSLADARAELERIGQQDADVRVMADFLAASERSVIR